jgi:hypothetical protein
MTDPVKRLVCIDIAAGRTLYSRTVYTEYVPVTEDLNFYYRELCGITDAIITTTLIDVPPDFNQALVAFSEQIPTRFPAYDITGSLEEADKIAKYHDYIQNLSEMEKSRAKLQVHIQTPATVPSGTFTPKASGSDVKRPILKQHAWVRELLASLESEEVPSDELVTVETDDLIPHAWVLTPVLGSVRGDRGSRLLVDAVKGKHWECLLGSSLFPDFIVSRRISTRGWLFQQEEADKMLRAMLDFYIASQDAKIVGGLSDWIPIADKDIGLLMTTFKKIKVCERVIKNQADPNHVYNVINSIEMRCLASKTTNPEIHPLSIHIFRKYFNYVAQSLGIPSEKYYNSEGITQIFRRWERSELGFRGDVDPIVPAWSKMWNLVMAGAPTVERVVLFLATLDAWNPMDGSTLSHDQCISIANQWVDIFAANELLRVEGKVEIALVVFDETRRWCLQYLPAGMFEKILSSSKYMTERYIGKGHTIIVGGSVRKFTNTSLRTPSKKTLYEGKVVDKTPDIPEPQLWKPHPYKPKKAVTPTAMGKVRGRPPKTGSVADNVRKGIVTLMSGSGGVSGGESSGSTSSVSSFNGQPELEPNDGTNELVMNLGSV